MLVGIPPGAPRTCTSTAASARSFRRVVALRVSTNGGIRWQKRWVNVSHILATLPVGLEPLASGTWNVFFGPIHLGGLDERDYRIHDRRGRSQRELHLSPIR
jgi:hypothetical protein